MDLFMEWNHHINQSELSWRMSLLSMIVINVEKFDSEMVGGGHGHNSWHNTDGNLIIIWLL